MRKVFILFTLVLLFSCKSGNSLDGIYEYVPNKDDNGNIFRMGRELGCSMIGRFEFRNSKCYFSIMGVEQRVDYEIDNGVIYLKSNELNNNSGAGIRIIDESTLNFGGCTFMKVGNNEDETITNEDSKSIENHSKNSENSQNRNQISNFPIYTYNKLVDKDYYEDGGSMFPEQFKEYYFLYGIVKKVLNEDGIIGYKIQITQTSKEFDDLHNDTNSLVNQDIVINLFPEDLYTKNGKKRNTVGKYDLSFKEYKNLKKLLVEGRKIKLSYVEGGAGSTGTSLAGFLFFNYIEKID
ncbi:MAG: hypothetical protein JSS94_06815 [Bacteroidetes bacterium]|nr:hypothetical protein [Bacteroidota bacterium]